MSDGVREVVEGALKAAEEARRAGDRVVSLCYAPDGMIALTETGRLFKRENDPGHYNDGRTTQKFKWTEIEGPL